MITIYLFLRQAGHVEVEVGYEIRKEAFGIVLPRFIIRTKETRIGNGFIARNPKTREYYLVQHLWGLYPIDHHWFDSYRFSFSTNGINYDSEPVQRFIHKNISHLSIGITIDGTERKHDMNRIWKPQTRGLENPNSGMQISERGSYKDVVRNIPLWLEQLTGGATKED